MKKIAPQSNLNEPTKSVTSTSVTSPRLVQGNLYHVYGWNYKAQFKLVNWDIIDDWAYIVTPKTGKKYYVPASKLFYTKKTKHRLAHEAHHD